MKILPLILRILAILFFLVPFVFYWYIRDYGRYLDMIHSPYPWSHMGSSTFQLWYIVVFPIFIGSIFLIVAYYIRKYQGK